MAKPAVGFFYSMDTPKYESLMASHPFMNSIVQYWPNGFTRHLSRVLANFES